MLIRSGRERPAGNGFERTTPVRARGLHVLASAASTVYAPCAMLRRLHVKNFKLLRDVEIEFEQDAPTVLIGPNASGKSTVLEVLDFLGRCAEDGLDEAVVAHGGMAAMRTAGVTAPIKISSGWRTSPEGRSLLWEFEIGSHGGGRPSILEESLAAGDRVLVGRSTEGRRVAFSENAKRPGEVELKGNQLSIEGVADVMSHPGRTFLSRTVAALRVLGTLASTPSWARSSAERASARDSVVISTQSFVGREGLGLATALYNLNTDHGEAWAQLERAFRSEFPYVKRIVFPADPGGSRIAFAIEDERFSGRKIYSSEMSDGMIIYLCLLSLIVHPKQNGVLALDEPDAHLHPSALRRLMALAHENHGKRALVMVTHSNALLDELRDPAASVRIVEPSPEGAKVRRLDPAALTAWRGEYSLSDLRRTGLLDPPNTAYGSDSGGGE